MKSKEYASMCNKIFKLGREHKTTEELKEAINYYALTRYERELVDEYIKGREEVRNGL